MSPWTMDIVSSNLGVLFPKWVLYNTYLAVPGGNSTLTPLRHRDSEQVGHDGGGGEGV